MDRGNTERGRMIKVERGARGRAGRAGSLLSAPPVLAVSLDPAFAIQALLDQFQLVLSALKQHEIAALALLFGILIFAVSTAAALVRIRSRTAARLAAAYNEVAFLREETDRALALMLSDPQVIVIWRDPKADPLILGDPGTITGMAVARRVLAFGGWLDPGRAHTIENAIEALRRRGETFQLALVTIRGRHVEADGRPIGGAAVVRFRDMTGAKLEHAALLERYQELEREAAGVRKLLEAVPAPIWIRNANGYLTFANRAYAAAVETAEPSDAVARRLELLDSAARAEAMWARTEGRAFAKRIPVVVAGARRFLDVFEVGGEHGAAGIGLDASEAESLRAELSLAVAAHRRTLDQLATAVAIFGADRRLVFHNAAYRALFQMEAAFLEDGPTDSAVLDRLRAERRLPEQADYRAWIAQLHEAYRAIEPKEHLWHLPGGRILRVVTNPNSEGGVTYLFDDMTERIELESRHNALIRIQSETLDALTEAVAVFGSDGRLRLFNPAFTELWKLSTQALADRPHIETIGEWCQPLTGAALTSAEQPGKPHSGSAADRDFWPTIKLAVTSLDRRSPLTLRMERSDGRMLDCAAVPLPDGGTLVTFRDVSDSARVERALMDRNEALLAADALKNAFVSHVSYELRSPLTTIIGFAQLLDDPVIGPLNDKQREYLQHITDSSATLLAIISDILDLATIDAGAMALELGEVDARAAAHAAAEGVRTRLAERQIILDIRIPPGIGSFVADEKRVRQVLFNLLSNAVGFSPTGETVTLSAERRPDAIEFCIIDRGAGIPSDLQERIFERFETRTLGSHHRGVGLGLSIVRSLMALHGGAITINSEPGQGTIAVCTFPIHAAAGVQAAE